MFDFATAGRITFGVGAIQQLTSAVRLEGTRVLIITGRDSGRIVPPVNALRESGCSVVEIAVLGEPTVDDITRAVQSARDHGAEVVVGIGGGSALDTAKATAAVATNPGDLIDYLEIVGRGKPLERPGLPCIAVPTTAGTGSEATRNAVIDVPAKQTKVSLRHDWLLPRLALIDPALTVSVPPEVTAATGFDALAQLIEPYVSNRSNPMTDALAVAGMKLVARSLRRAYEAGADLDARTDMALASWWGGVCLANARLGAVHGLAGPIGGMFHAHHGAICAALLAPTVRANVAALMRRPEKAVVLERYTDIARLLTNDAGATVEQGIDWIARLARDLRIKPLSAFGVSAASFDSIVARARVASSMQGNPVELEAGELSTILEAAS